MTVSPVFGVQVSRDNDMKGSSVDGSSSSSSSSGVKDKNRQRNDSIKKKVDNTDTSSDEVNTIVSNYISRKSAEEIDLVHSRGGENYLQSLALLIYQK